jgi:tetratricopeptide (TPR) repeat protein
MTRPGSHNPTIESLKDRVARDPFSRAFLQLAEEYRKEGRYQEAIDVCLEGLQRHPTYHTARIALGRTQMEAGDLEAARKTFAEVLDLQPENHLAAKLLAEIQTKTGDSVGAVETYRNILRYYPEDREVAALLQEAQPPLVSPATTPIRQDPPFAAGPPVPEPDDSPFQVAVTAPRTLDPSPDFRPEDFGGKALAADREGPAPAAVVPASWTGPRPEDPIEPMDDALQTNTLAEVYLRQGLVDRAVEVYRGMLRVDPTNRKAAARLGELAPAGGASLPVEFTLPVEPPAPAASAPAPAGRMERAQPTVLKNDDGARRQTIMRLERWLAQVSSGSARGATP